MKICKECKYFYHSHIMDYCKNPKNGINLVNGEIDAKFASVARMDVTDPQLCGAEGRWFEPAPPPVVEVKKRRSLLEWFKDIGK